jgi:hypothetical protein
MNEPSLDNLPEFFRERRCWAFSAPDCRYFNRKIKAPDDYGSKAPMQSIAIDPVADFRVCVPAGSHAPATWVKLETIKTMLNDAPEGCAGVMMQAESGWVGIDIDREKLADNPELLKWADDMIACFPGYGETSPSGIGFRGFVKGNYSGNNRKGAFEAYTEGRFLRVTGNQVQPSRAITDPQQWLDTFAKHMGQKADRKEIYQGVRLGAMPSFADASAAMAEALELMHYADEATWRDALTNGLGSDTSNAMNAMVCAAAKVHTLHPDVLTPETVFLALWAIPAVRNEYGDKAADIERRYVKYWWPDAIAKAPDMILNDGIQPTPEQIASSPKLAAKVGQQEVQREVAQQALVVAAAQSKAMPPLEERCVPKTPDIPNTWLFKLIEADIRKDTRGLEKEDFIKVATFFTVGTLCSMIAHYGTSKANPLMLIGAGTGEGKTVAHDYMDALRKFSPEFEKAIIGICNIGSAEGLRDNVAPHTLTLHMNDECGGEMISFVSGSAKEQVVFDFLMRAATATTIDFPALSNSKDNIEKKIRKSDFIFASLMQTQVFNIKQIFQERYVIAGGARFFIMFPKPPPKGKPGAKFIGVPTSEVTNVVNAISSLMSRRRYISFNTDAYFPNEAGDAGDIFTDRLISRTKALKASYMLEPMQRRMTEMAIKWAVIHATSRLLQPQKPDEIVHDNCVAGIDPMNMGWLRSPLYLEEQDVEFGLSMAQLHAEGCAYIVTTEGAALQTQEHYDMLVYMAIKAHAVKRIADGGNTLQPAVIHREFSPTGAYGEKKKRGRPMAGATSVNKPSAQKIKDDYLKTLVDDKFVVRDPRQDSYVMADGLLGKLDELIAGCQQAMTDEPG